MNLFEHMIRVYKPVGMTPLECITSLQARDASLAGVTLSYAGRLDPMAEGLVLILVGDENKQRDQYLKLDKKYEVEMILGIETDSFDVLGVPVGKSHSYVNEEKIQDVLKGFEGMIDQHFPPFSSKTVKGKPLYWWAREKRLNEIAIPSEMRIIYDIQFNDMHHISRDEMYHEIKQRLKSVHGNFRQDIIKDSWERLCADENKSLPYQFSRIRFTVSCSSGTYIRSLVDDIGKKLNTGAFVISLVRTSIGEFSDCDVDLRS